MSKYTKLAETLPWVTRLKKSQKCDSYVRPPLSLYFDGMGKRRTKYKTLEEYRCKRTARWQYRALKKKWSHNESGTYCWSHLVSQLQSMEEVDRQAKYWKSNPSVRDGILATQA